MKTKPNYSATTLFNNFEWFAKRHHNRLMRRLRDEQKYLKCAVRVALKAIGVSVLMLSAAFAQPPFPNPMGRQSPYISTVDVRVTNTVTTVYDLTYLRTIRIQVDGSNTMARTNFLLMDTNVMSVATNTTPVTPN